MKLLQYGFVLVLFAFSAHAQVIQDSEKMGYTLQENDTILSEPILLEEVVIQKEKLDPETKKQFLLLQNRVYKVYPFAKIGTERLTILNQNLEHLKTEREKRKYSKIIQEYLEKEFTDQLKKLSRKQGQILVKLIHRQTGFTTFELIKDYKSGWKAFWSNTTAKVFDINLKTKYNPTENNEDFFIETILYRAFNSGRLVKQEAALPIDYDELQQIWENKAKQQNSSKAQ
ncbi:hypothetical protein B0A58_06085 [Flavobacterium branchiophilum NBRC 15030 = ATCC 35035]|uniref:DUF4294 domain-containing protein n=2 Tax=Flavobacterium branchiophilum TaxID=55197 RepID=G2Z2W3_FLABF|nr:DUF4294 domain-containing protein [Flavobacterium branchiophilum]OXA76979.1 hypothetical protein B0A58_06085 [Flavobacterium branchiophilum NBRC 15030 = ATCC 35035]PDS23743.1 DUF4294 domain-containing protein [Flavobacterium branchiophilum]TQM39562.1 uncharacterized protein DUF4294 [Flavobacterium branchiophilum]CCB70292.1 Protein of unknown function precursor [Flavobacterium branchiophilum FL-15]GEM54089.1 hypothetical protein FB1_03100 [Flavobacterium branchiophilum NBRC 15030 = ATCC 3503